VVKVKTVPQGKTFSDRKIVDVVHTTYTKQGSVKKKVSNF